MMTRRPMRTVLYALAACLGVFGTMSWAQTQTQNTKKPAKAATTTQQNVPEEYQSGIAQLRVAKAYLEKAGDKWGGYRVKGIASIDRAFRVFGVSPESTPDEMQSGNTDEPSMMNSGISSLQTAKGDIANVSDNWGGRKEKGIALIDQALQDLQTGIDWAKEHKTY
jgi:hypothetical protein